jgi:hypothetical protein
MDVFNKSIVIKGPGTLQHAPVSCGPGSVSEVIEMEA